MNLSGALSSVKAVAIYCFLACVVFPCQGYYQGRHVCSRMVSKRVPVQQSYRKPVFREDLGRNEFITSYRTIFRMVPSVVRECCRGWEKRNPREGSCMKPKCNDECENGGECIAPDLCLCPRGFAGYKCHIDIDECSGRNQCQQDCTNTVGSYTCTCRHGFKVAADGKSCDLCVSCTAEFKEMQEQLTMLNQKVIVLEEEKENLQANLTSAFNSFTAQEVSTSSKPLSTTTVNPYGNEQTNFKKRLESLSHQISGLEEKISYCDCQQNYFN